MASLCYVMVALCVIWFFPVLVLSSYNEMLKQFDVEALPNLTETEIQNVRFQAEPAHLSQCLFPSDCREVQKCDRNKSGVYQIFPFGIGKGFMVYCDMVTDGGGWLVFQRRQDGTVDFYRDWQNYKNGFGNFFGEFWLGLEKIHILTTLRQNQLMVNLGRFDGVIGSAKYERFRISDEPGKYRLLVESYSGNIGDSMAYHNGMTFSTHDRDSDKFDKNCAAVYYGAWWYDACYHSNLNGEYIQKGESTTRAKEAIISWHAWQKSHKPLQFVEMKMRPAYMK